jgi:hypothetical protein
MEKAKIFADWANFEAKQNRKNTRGKNTWCLDAKVQLETDYDLLGEETGGFDENEEYDVLWKNRTNENKTNTNNIVRWSEYKYVQEFPNWMIANYEDKMEFKYIQLVESVEHQPYWNIRIKYITHSESFKELEKLIQDTFDHYFRAGNVNFSLQKTKWRKC